MLAARETVVSRMGEVGLIVGVAAAGRCRPRSAQRNSVSM
jgi:hypothetical protein